MSPSTALVIARVLEIYALAGLVFALLFLPLGLPRVDPRIGASPWTVRLLLLPGVAAFWPLFVRRWIGSRS